MKDFNPEFAKEKELGSWSAEFLLNIISSNEDTWGQEDSLKNLYMDIAEMYSRTKFQYQQGRDQNLINLFGEYFETKYPNDDDWDDEIYDREFEAFSKRHGETECYLFEISYITID